MKAERKIERNNTSLNTRLEDLEATVRDLKSQVETDRDRSNMVIKILLLNNIQDSEKAFRQAKLIEKFETYSRIIQSK